MSLVPERSDAGADDPKDPQQPETSKLGLLLPEDLTRRRTEVIVLRDRPCTFGRAPECDFQITAEPAGDFRDHACIEWRDPRHVLRDPGSQLGTSVNGVQVAPGESVELKHGDVLRFSSVVFHYLRVDLRGPGLVLLSSRYADVARGLASLEPRAIVERGLELLRLVSGVERSLLVAADDARDFGGLLTPMSHPELKLSFSSVRRALEERRTISFTYSAKGPVQVSRSAMELSLRRVWVHPLLGTDARPIAAVYLDSATVGAPMTPQLEERLIGVCDHIALALRNAALYLDLLDLNQTLEQRVLERTLALERSQAQIVAQDRLVTLGRLVAGIAHELNNPAGAIASLSATLALALPVLQRGDAELAAAFAEPSERNRCEAWRNRLRSRAPAAALDTRSRRALEDGWRAVLASRGTLDPQNLAAMLSRAGLEPEGLALDDPIAGPRAGVLADVLEREAMFLDSLSALGESASAISRIVAGLKTYAHLDRTETEVAELHRGIQAALTVLRPRIPPDVEVVTSFADLPPLRHQPGPMMQVWTNLIDNSLHAMGDSGRLEIRTSASGGDVIVEVSDTGPGVPDSIRDRLFEIAVTTKGPGAGLGLGLAICRRIVEEGHGGRLDFESSPGRTVFYVSLPAS